MVANSHSENNWYNLLNIPKNGLVLDKYNLILSKQFSFLLEKWELSWTSFIEAKVIYSIRFIIRCHIITHMARCAVSPKKIWESIIVAENANRVGCNTSPALRKSGTIKLWYLPNFPQLPCSKMDWRKLNCQSSTQVKSITTNDIS